MSEEFDPYAILGVSADASIDEIKKAYRARVMKCHPDRGGSASEMIAVAEAWEILSDADARACFDESRRRNDQVTQTRWEAAKRAARSCAEACTRTWESLRDRMSKVAVDFAKAQYTTINTGAGMSTSMATGRISAYIFSLGGFLLGLISGIAIIASRTDTTQGLQFLPVGIATAGGWLGSRAH